jgi:Alpha/beta hydrolase domain
MPRDLASAARHACPLVALVALVALAPPPAEARITRLEITRVESPTFGGTAFDSAGPYERLVGKAYGEVDPAHPLNAIIQDIALAPRNARGMVEYSTDIHILKPVDLARGNGVLFFNIVNRGNKGGLSSYNARISGTTATTNQAADAGDGFMMRHGFSLVWFGWQADVLAGDDRLTMQVPVARNPDGSSITGIVREEIVVQAPTTTVNLSTGHFSGFTHASYPTVSVDNRAPLADGFLPTLTVRGREQDPRVVIPNSEWSFASCPEGAVATPSDTRLCYPAGFQPGRLYELTYRAKDPTVLGLGYAAMRDLAAFFKHEQRDTSGTVNPLYRAGAKAVIQGSSQSARNIRTFLHLGFNQDESGRIAYDGAYPHIGGGLASLNIRFAHPGRAWGEQVDHLYPAYDFPFTYARIEDPITGRTQGVLDRCTVTNTCPLIFHVATALEIWEGRQSLGLTDPLGTRDVSDPANVRTYIMASTQHAVPPLPLAARPPFGNCQQQPNPNPQRWTMRALLVAFTAWVRDGVAPPPSAVPRIADGTLLPPENVRFPVIPANEYGGVPRPAVRFLGVTNPLRVLDFGPQYTAGNSSGIVTLEPPRQGDRAYRLLVPGVDADGNDIAGIRSVHLQAPIGTYTGWNLGRAGRFEDGFCSLQGSFIPFALTRAERLATGDPRPSIEERYPTPEAYVAAVRRAAEQLVAQRYLLADDAIQLITQAEREGIRAAP